MQFKSHLLTYGAPYIRGSLLHDNCQYCTQIDSEYDRESLLYSELFPRHYVELIRMHISTAAIPFPIAFELGGRPLRADRSAGCRDRGPDQGIRSADTPHTRARRAWRSFDG